MAESQTENTLDFKKLVPVLVVVLVDVLGLTILIPVLPYYAIAFGADALTLGLLGSAYPAMQFIFAPILGNLSDRIGRKPVLATAQMGTFFSLLLLGFSGALWVVFLSRILDGITGANFSTAQSVITDSTDEENRARGLGLIGATFGIGFVIGPALSGLALWASGNNYSAPAFLAAGFAFVSVLLTTFMLEETHPPEKRGTPSKERGLNFGRMRDYMLHPTLGVIFLFVFLNQVIFGSFQLTFAPFTLTKLGLNSLGNVMFFSAFGIISAIMQGGLAGPLNKRFGEQKLVYAGLLIFGMGFFLTGFTPSQPVSWYSRDALVAELQQGSATTAQETLDEQLQLLPEEGIEQGNSALFYMLGTMLLVPIGFGLIGPNISSLLTKRADPQKIGEVLGVSAAITALGSVIGPLAGGAIFEGIGPNWVFLLGGIAAFFLLALMWVKLKPVD